jgi:hypothetical protein
MSHPIIGKKNARTNFCQNPPDKQGISGDEINGTPSENQPDMNKNTNLQQDSL